MSLDAVAPELEFLAASCARISAVPNTNANKATIRLQSFDRCLTISPLSQATRFDPLPSYSQPLNL